MLLQLSRFFFLLGVISLAKGEDKLGTKSQDFHFNYLLFNSIQSIIYLLGGKRWVSSTTTIGYDVTGPIDAGTGYVQTDLIHH